MVVLRRTQKLRPVLPESPVVPAESDTALGDWYVNRIVVHRQPLLILVSSKSLLPMLLPARDVKGLPSRLASVVEARLKRFGIADQAIAAEVRAMDRVAVGPTEDRSVLGIMVDSANYQQAQALIRYDGERTALWELHARLLGSGPHGLGRDGLPARRPGISNAGNPQVRELSSASPHSG